MTELEQLIEAGMPFMGQFFKVTPVQGIEAMNNIIIKGVRGFLEVLKFDIDPAVTELENDLPYNVQHAMSLLKSFDLIVNKGTVDVPYLQGVGQLSDAVGQLWDLNLNQYHWLGFESKPSGKVIGYSANLVDGFLDTIENFYESLDNNIPMFEKMIVNAPNLVFFTTINNVPGAFGPDTLEDMQNDYFLNLPENEKNDYLELVDHFRERIHGKSNNGFE